jgi:hypothetical protein
MRTPRSMLSRPSRQSAVAVLVGLCVAACDSGQGLTTQPQSVPVADAATPARPGTSPATTSGTTGSTTPGTGTPGTGTSGTGGSTGTQGSTNVDSILISELARIAARQEAEQSVYDALKVEWQKVLDDTTGRYRDSLMCDPKQYVATAKIVGPEGADINFGEHSLRIPSGALTTRTVITAEAPTSLRALAIFSPHGTQFVASRHPTLELSYKHCKGPLNRAARIAYVNASGAILEWPPSQDFPDLGLVRGLIGHFSNYMVAY